MTTTLLTSTIILFGVAICGICAVGFYAPNQLIRLVKSAWPHHWTMYLAILFRLLLGAVLVVAADDTKFPVTFEIFGWLAVVASAGIPFAGRSRIGGMINWWEQRSANVVRLWVIVGLLFGSFLIYGAI